MQDQLLKFCLKNNFILNEVQLKQLTTYISQLEKWNKTMNLVGKQSFNDILESLVIDSFYLASFIQKLQLTNPITWDLGAGAGLPGIPLRILWPDGQYYLIEARQKRTLFMSSILAKIKVPNTFVECARAENFMQAKKADLILSRAFMPPDKLFDFVEDHLKSQLDMPNISDMTAQKAKLIMLNKEVLASSLKFELIESFAYQVKNDQRYFNLFQKRK